MSDSVYYSSDDATPSGETLTKFLLERLTLLSNIKSERNDEKEHFAYLVHELEVNKIFIENNGGDLLNLNFDDHYMIDDNILHLQMLEVIDHLRLRVADVDFLNRLDALVSKINKSAPTIVGPMPREVLDEWIRINPLLKLIYLIDNAIPLSEAMLTKLLVKRLKLLSKVKSERDNEERFEYLVHRLTMNEIGIIYNGGESLNVIFDRNDLVNDPILNVINHLRSRITNKYIIDKLDKIVDEIDREYPVKEPIDE